MSGPWEQFQPAESGPWAKFQDASVAADVGKQLATGTALGVAGMGGMLGDLRQGLSSATDWAGGKLGAAPETIQKLKDYASTAAQMAAGPAGIAMVNAPTSAQNRAAIESVTGKLPEAQTMPGEYARTFGEFLPGAIGGPEGIVGRLLGRVALPAAMSETAGQLTKGSAAEPYARIAGALAAPGAQAVGRVLGAPVISNIQARVNPAGYAERQVARALSESGVSAADAERAVQQAAAEGQGVFTLADALGNAGQRMLRSAASGPGEGRTAIVDALEGRQGGQGRRIASALAEGFGAPQTAAETRDAMTAARNAAADAEYSAVRNGAANSRVDVVPAINNLDRNIGTQPGQALVQANDSVEATLRPFRERLARVNPDDFEAVARIRGDMADAAQSARQSGQGNRARLIGQAVRELDASLEAASPGYRQANANYAQRTRDIQAVDLGRQAARQGRTEDTIPRFQAQSREGQRAFRTGYVDPLIADAQGAAFGVNKARPLINEAFQAEGAAMAPGNPMMQRRIGRENTMFETRNTALGGSKTDMNLADAAALGLSPEVLSAAGHAMTGNWGGLLHTALAAGKNGFTGNTAQVRREVARLLLQRAPDLQPGQLQSALDRIMRRRGGPSTALWRLMVANQSANQPVLPAYNGNGR